MNVIPIRFTLNGSAIEAALDGETTLLTYLRRHLGLTGAKLGCGRGQCGTCTVLLNGKPVKSCTLRLKSSRLRNAVEETIESLSSPGKKRHPIQLSFLQHGVLQCGFCTAPAIANAIYDAAGVRMTELPIRAESIREALKNEETD